MSVTYVAVDPAHGRIEYIDRKRHWWLLSVVYPLLPFAGMAAHATSGREIALGLPLLISYGLMPLLDFIIGEDENNPDERVVPHLEADRYYRRLTWATVPLHFHRANRLRLVGRNARPLVVGGGAVRLCSRCEFGSWD